MAVLAPIPRARVSTATRVKPGLLASLRQPYRRSAQTDPIIATPPEKILSDPQGTISGLDARARSRWLPTPCLYFTARGQVADRRGE